MPLRVKSSVVSVCLLLAGLATIQARQTPGQQKPNPSQSIQVEVDMVSLPVVVTTRDGRRVTNLTRSDFQVFEDGLQQNITGFGTTDEPVDVLLAIDTSGSVEQKLGRIQKAAITFVNELHPDDEVAVMSFAHDVELLEDFSIDRARNASAIKDTRPGGSTVIYEAVWLALEEVLKPVQERTALVLFTDGVDTASRKASIGETLDLAKETRATIYSVYYNTEADMQRDQQGTWGRPPFGRSPPIVIGSQPPVYGPGSSSMDYARGREYLAKLSEFSGGMVYDALKLEDLDSAFKEIVEELASQYSIGYYSTNAKHDGKFRKVEVKLSRPDLVVRTKKGYFAKKDKMDNPRPR